MNSTQLTAKLTMKPRVNPVEAEGTRLILQKCHGLITSSPALRKYMVLIAILILTAAQSASVAKAQVSFVEGGQQLNCLIASGVALADLNGDGKLDAFVANDNPSGGSDNRVYFNAGSGGFTDSGQRLLDPTGSGPNAVAGDINGDGKIEVITGRTVWLNDGGGGFAADTNRFVDSDHSDFLRATLADLNGDGHLDVFAIVWKAPSRIYTNDGSGLFSDTGQRIGQGIQANVVLRDVNGDGSIDAVTTGWKENSLPGGTNNYCPNRVWTNNGSGMLTGTGQVLDEAARHIHAMALGDVDNDGHPDLVIGMTAAPWAKVYRNDGVGRFSLSQSFGNRWIESMALGYLNGDGWLDIYLGCGSPPAPDQVWTNNRTGQFVNSGLGLDPAHSTDVAIGDVDGDGDFDVFVVNAGLASGSASPARVYCNNLIPPRINTARNEGALTLWWGVNATGFALENAGAATGPWTNVPGVTGYSATLPVNIGTNQFFRLNK
jgi:hypothetical protein